MEQDSDGNKDAVIEKKNQSYKRLVNLLCKVFLILQLNKILLKINYFYLIKI